MLRIKRAYEPVERSDGYRVLVDRLWPRGVSRSALHMDEWARILAPSTKLRTAFGHDPARWRTFRAAYRKELRASDAAMRKIRALTALSREQNVTLIYGAKDEEHNNAVVLQELMKRRAPKAIPRRLAA
jgi:uncharacterized protein YeaO (DUF488 family)